MSSKTLFYNMGNCLRRRVWFPALMLIIFLFALPISTAMQVQSFARRLSDGASLRLENITGLVNSSFSYNNSTLIIILIILAVITSMLYFSYMHRKNQVDFYHSLPARRSNLFMSNYLAGVLAVFIPYLINILLTVAVVAALGFFSSISWVNLLLGLLVNLLFFLAVYTVGAFSAVLCGSTGVQGILTMCMLGVPPALIGCYQWVRNALQVGWYEQLIDWDQIITYSSPASRYVMLTGLNSDSTGLMSGLDYVIVIAFVAVMLLLCLWAYSRRPSEAAGRALAFPRSRAWIKYPIMLTATAAFAMIMHEIGDNSGSYTWYFIGAVLGGFISAQIMEIVYRFDFRGIKKKLLPMLILLIVYAGVSLGLIHDVINYNSYVADEDEIAWVDVRLSGLDDYAYTFSGADSSYSRNRISTSERMDAYLKAGTCHDAQTINAVLALAQRCVEDGSQTVIYEEIPEEGQHNTVSLVVRYHLQNGTVKVRDYSRMADLDVCDISNELQTIYADTDFRAAQLGLFAYDDDCIRLCNVENYQALNDQSYEYSSQRRHELINTDISELMTAYRREMLAIDGTERMNSMPLGSLSFYVFDSVPGAIDFDNTPSGAFRSYDYPIYPSCKETLAILAELGYKNWQVDLEQITKIDINFYNYEEIGIPAATDIISSYAISESTVDKDWRADTVTDREAIAKIINESYPSEAFRYNNWVEYDHNYEIEVRYDLNVAEDGEERAYEDYKYRYFLLHR